MTAKHTPGPWHVGMRPGPIVYGPEGEQIANMHVPMLPAEEHRANARLIAEAPAMLDALRAVLQVLNHGTENPHWPHVDTIRAILARIDGEG